MRRTQGEKSESEYPNEQTLFGRCEKFRRAPSCHRASRSLRFIAILLGVICDQYVGSARVLAKGVRSRSSELRGSTTNKCRFSSPFSSFRNMMYRPSGVQSCQLIGRPLVRVTGCPATILSAGDTHTFITPSAGASHDNN